MTNHEPTNMHSRSFRRTRRRRGCVCARDQIGRSQGALPTAPHDGAGAIKLFSLHAADGTPIIITDSREAAVTNAREHDSTPSAFTNRKVELGGVAAAEEP